MRFVGRESNGHKHINEFFEKLTPSIQVAMLLEQENISRLCKTSLDYNDVEWFI